MPGSTNKELNTLLGLKADTLDPWLIGNIPKHYKRISVSPAEALELAKEGAAKFGAYYNTPLYFSQAVLAGAILSGKYTKFVITTPSQYGKSWEVGHLALIRAYEGNPIYVAAASGDGAQIIMQNVVASIQEAAPEVQNALLVTKDEIDRLAKSVSKTKIAFKDGGFVEAISLADTYQDNITRNKAIGRGGEFFVDEAALVSSDTFAEMGRREFARIDKKKYPMVMISNPHNPGYFYDELTEDEPLEDTFILWMDALTAIEEDRFSEKQVLESDFAKNKRDRKLYLLCELDVDGESMFETPKIYQAPFQSDYIQYFLGVDAAYKGKDSIELALNAVSEEGKCHIEEILELDKGEWIDGVTSEQIIGDIARIIRRYRVPLTCIDIGFGVWLVEGLAKLGFNVMGVNFGEKPTRERIKARQYAATNAQNKRAEMHLDLQNLIEDDYIRFSEDAWEKVKDTFPFVTSERKAGGKIQVCPKSEIKAKIGHSPDALDSVLLSIQAPIRFNGEFTTYDI